MLADAVLVSFFEHLVDERWMRPLVLPWLGDDEIRASWPLWEQRLAHEEIREIERLRSQADSSRPYH